MSRPRPDAHRPRRPRVAALLVATVLGASSAAIALVACTIPDKFPLQQQHTTSDAGNGSIDGQKNTPDGSTGSNTPENPTPDAGVTPDAPDSPPPDAAAEPDAAVPADAADVDAPPGV